MIDIKKSDTNNEAIRGEKSTSLLSNQHSNVANLDFQSLELKLIGTMVPGIIHNMATPLSGVIGATQLLESRVEMQDNLLEALKDANNEVSMQLHKQFEKHKSGLDMISRNAKQLTDLLQILVTRIQLSGARQPQLYSVSDTIRNEVKFLEANMIFKHKVRKDFHLVEDLPSVAFVYSHVVTVLDEFVLQTIAAHDFKSGLMDMIFSSQSSEGDVLVKVETKFRSAFENCANFDNLTIFINRAAESGCKTDVENIEGNPILRISIPRHGS